MDQTTATTRTVTRRERKAEEEREREKRAWETTRLDALMHLKQVYMCVCMHARKHSLFTTGAELCMTLVVLINMLIYFRSGREGEKGQQKKCEGKQNRMIGCFPRVIVTVGLLQID